LAASAFVRVPVSSRGSALEAHNNTFNNAGNKLRGIDLALSIQLLCDATACCIVGGSGWNSLCRKPARAKIDWYSANV
jgi:hypothetical protein